MPEQVTNTIMMVRPAAFQKNEETAINNFFQQASGDVESAETIQKHAMVEFDGFVFKLRAHGINVIVFEDDEKNGTPDSIFCNNWNSFHEDGTVYFYPMFAENRRKEVRMDIVDALQNDFQISKIHSFTHWETKGHFLEGTGSIIMDRPNHLAYASISDRTQQEVLMDFSDKTGFEVITFTAYQTVEDKRLPIYHTNVMMCMGEEFVLICLDCIDDPGEQEMLRKSFQNTGKTIIEIVEAQIDQFAGNMLQVKNKDEKRFVVMSESAYQSLDHHQLKELRNHGDLIHHPLPTIEKYGGGSARCMMAEIFLQPNRAL
ncbi:citrulline utilization hydrolase CtlX [Marinoscillum sp. MHG1-6]|uniref:citrulline utilization hydrolase CtlX n=1 Tax=Marinoscillum sp. MHG1-6 TaxID=2959627 RepID=UPI002157927D|nr:arginine deiminase-related protein [Marinoscillum sp. MHG1-6]